MPTIRPTTCARLQMFELDCDSGPSLLLESSSPEIKSGKLQCAPKPQDKKEIGRESLSPERFPHGPSGGALALRGHLTVGLAFDVLAVLRGACL